jgi:hypothetical protein
VLRSSTVLPFQSAMVAPPTVTLSASGLSRAPLQRGHGHWLGSARGDPDVELVAVGLDLLEEALDARETVAAS